MAARNRVFDYVNTNRQHTNVPGEGPVA